MYRKSYLIAILFVLLMMVTLTWTGGAAVLPAPAAPAAISSTQYVEDFTSYTYKSYTEDTVWDTWQGHVRLSKYDAIDQSYPATASDNDGNLLIVWIDSRDGDENIYAQKMDGNGNKLWGSDVRVNSDSGTAYQRYPAIASDSEGNLLIVWQDERNSDSDIYAQKVSGNGNKLWSSDVRVNNDSGTAYQYVPTIASDNDSNLLIVWEDHRNGDSDIYTQKVDGNGNKLWDSDVRVNSDSGMADQDFPAIASDNGGNLLIVWHDSRNGSGNPDIYAQKVNENGNKLWSTDVRVNSDSGTAYQRYPTITSDHSGNLLIVWEDERDGSDIYAQKVDGNGNKVWGSDVRVNGDSGLAYQLYPAIATDNGDNLLIVWNDARNGDNIYAQKVDGNGNKLWSSDVQVNSDSGTAYQLSPAIARAQSGNLLIVWEDSRNGSYGKYDIYAQKIDGNGNKLWGSDVRVNSDSGTDYQFSPDIASDNSGNLLIVWEDSRNGSFSNRDIYAQKVDGNGNKLWGNDVRVNSDSSMAYQYSPTIASDNSGNLLIVWQDGRNGNDDIYAQKLNGGGSKLWANDLQVVYPDLFYLPSGVVESKTVDITATNILQARLTATTQLNGGAVQYFLTNNGGQDWFAVTPGITHSFTTTGSDLRWHAALTTDESHRNSPVINNLQISYSNEVWTLMVYMACDADTLLDIGCQQAMARLQQAAANPNLIIIALYDKPGANNSYRYHVQPNGVYTDNLNRWYLGELDTSQPETLANFITWGRSAFTAPHSALFILGHGLGHMGMAWDWTTGEQAYLTPTELRSAVNQGTGFGAASFDLVFYDACLMGLIEHAHQLDGLAQALVASENPIWLPFPYQQLGSLIDADTTARQLAASMVNAYAAAYSHRPYTISAMDLAYLPPVVAATDSLAQVLESNMTSHQASILNSRTASQKFNTHDWNTISNTDAYLDLYHFADRLETFVAAAAVQTAAATLKNAIGQPGGNFIIAEAHASGLYTGSDGNQYYWDLGNAHGVAIYFPHTTGGPGFDGYMAHQFRFTMDTAWSDFLAEYYGVIGAPPDPGGDPELPPVLVSNYPVFLPLVVR